jgi:hypothetical protein
MNKSLASRAITATTAEVFEFFDHAASTLIFEVSKKNIDF